MKPVWPRTMIPVLFVCLAVSPASAQFGPVVITEKDEKPIDRALAGTIVDSVAAALEEIYVFPDVAEKMVHAMRENLKKGKYDDAKTISRFTEALSGDLREISHDLHLGVQFITDEMIASMPEGEEADDFIAPEAIERLRKENFRFRKAEILEGNVGLLRLDGFVNTEYSGPTAVAAMNFFAHTDALIIDLRQNGGGSPSLIQLMMGYLLDESTHLNSFYVRKEDRTDQFWSLPYTPGPNMSGVDLYVLTSERTGSAAEEFAYNVQSLERGTIVGGVTWGGAHPVEMKVWKNLNAGMRVPFGRAVNPVTGTNWEGVGVKPDLDVPPAQAFDVAYLEALKKLDEREEDPAQKSKLAWAIGGLEAELHPVEVPGAKLESYTGIYEDRKLTFEEGHLYYQRGDRPKMAAIPMGEALFRFDAVDFFRLEVVTDGSGKPVLLKGHYDNGMNDESPRTGD